MLTLEQCKNLAKWGLLQALKPGEWYWAESVFGGWREYCWLRVSLPKVFYKIPTLEELMEFARGLDVPGGFALYARHGGGWGCLADITSPTPTEAVYVLIEKLVEVRKVKD